MRSLGAARALWVIAAFCLLFPVLGLVRDAAATEDLRSTVRFRYSCESDLARREITLFANGTLRLRQGPWNDLEMLLEELGPEELVETLDELAQLWSMRTDKQDLEPLGVDIKGQWSNRCELDIALPGEDPVHLEMSAFDAPPLVVSRLIHFADRLVEDAAPPPPADRVPSDYDPQNGDILVNAQGHRYQVVRRTADNKGVELLGIDQPYTLLVELDDLPSRFVKLTHSAEANRRR